MGLACDESSFLLVQSLLLAHELGFFDRECFAVGYFLPDAFISQLESWAAEDAAKSAAPPQASTFGKYKIKHSVVSLTAEELKEREDAALRLLAETMRNKKKKP